MNRVINNEMIAAQDEDAIRHLEARYKADPRLLDDPKAEPLSPPSEALVGNHFAMLRTLAARNRALAGAHEAETSQTHEEAEIGPSLLHLSLHTWPPDSIAALRRLLDEEIEVLENREAAYRRLADAIDRYRLDGG